MARVTSRLSYSIGNEDCRTEHQALKIQSGDRVVCITASGDRPLHLLLADAGEVIAIDANAHQNHLFELKKAALKTLPYDQYAAFLGVSPMEDRLVIWEKLRENLSLSSRDFWDSRCHMIDKGVLYQGSIEKWCRRLAKFVGFMRGKKVQKLFQFKTLEEQREFLAEWETKGLKRFFACFFHPVIARIFLRQPGLYRHVGEGVRPSEYMYQRFHGYLRNHLAKDSPLASLALLGKVTNDNLPPYLSRLGCALIRSRLDRLSHEHYDILAYLKDQPDSSIDVFSLSDVASYVDEHVFHELMSEVVRTAKSGARFCMRQFLSLHEIPGELSFFLRRDEKLEKKLELEDRCFVYRFMAGNIVK